MMRLEARTGGDGLASQVYRFYVAHVKLGARQQPPNRTDSVEHADAARDDFRQHGLKHEVVDLVDDRDLEIVAAPERFLERLCRVDAGKAAPQYDDSLSSVSAHRQLASLNRSRFGVCRVSAACA